MNCCSSSRAAMAAVAGHCPLLSSACSSTTHRGHEQQRRRQWQRAYGSPSPLVSLCRRSPLVHHATPHSCLYATTAFSNGGRHCHLSNNGLRELSISPQRANAFSCHGRLDSGAVEGEEGDEAVTSTFAGTSAASATGGPVAASSPWKPPRRRHRHHSDTSRCNREGRRDTHNTASLHGAPPAGLRGSTRPSSAHRSKAGHSTRSSRRNAPPPPPQLEGKKKDINVKTAPPHGQQRLWSAAALVRHINSATDTGDWVTALRLCLHTSPAHTREKNYRTGSSSPTINPATSGSLDGNPLPPLHRLRKALAACEAVSHPSGAAWQGALALWHYAQELESTNHPASTTAPAPAALPPRSAAHDSADLQRVYGRIFSLLGTATRWREALACLAATRTAYVDGFVVAQVAYALRASPARLDRAVLDLWAAWRCRVGDAAEPSEEMVVQLLQAMLHMTAQQVPHESSSTNDRAEKAASADAHRQAKEETAALAATVATRLLSSAAAAHVAERAARHPADSACPAASHRLGRGRLPGAALPLNWARHRRLVHRLYADRWRGTWAEALCVGLAGEDVELIRHVAPHVPASHPPTLYAETMRYLQLQRVAVSAADRAALWSCWLEGKDGKYGAVGGGGEKVREDVEEEAVSGDALARGAGRAAAGGAGALVEDAQSAELLLDELLGEY